MEVNEKLDNLVDEKVVQVIAKVIKCSVWTVDNQVEER